MKHSRATLTEAVLSCIAPLTFIFLFLYLVAFSRVVCLCVCARACPFQLTYPHRYCFPLFGLHGQVFGQGAAGQRGNLIYSATLPSRLAMRVVEFWKMHPLAAAAGVSLCGSDGEVVVVEALDERTRM